MHTEGFQNAINGTNEGSIYHVERGGVRAIYIQPLSSNSDTRLDSLHGY